MTATEEIITQPTQQKTVSVRGVLAVSAATVILAVSGSFVIASIVAPVGPRGPQGAQGITGEQGERGLRGTTGKRGIQGKPGAAGTNGTNGVNGTTAVIHENACSNSIYSSLPYCD